MSTVIKYEDVAVGAKISFSPAAADNQDFSVIELLKEDDNPVIPLSFNEKNMFPLRRTERILKVDSVVALWSKSKSGADGAFSSPPTIEFIAPGLYSSNGFTFTFEGYMWPSELEIIWYNGLTELERQFFHPSSPTYFCNHQVLNFNRVVMRFLSMRFPDTWLKIRDIIWGVKINITDEPDAEYRIESVSVIQEINQISREITVNVMDFSFVSQGDISFMFQRKQTMALEHKDELKGVFFVDKGTRTGAEHYSVNAQDYVAQIPQFLGGVYSGKTALSLAQDILGDIPFEMSSALHNRPVNGHVPITSGMTALALLCFAIGAVCDTSNSDKVLIYELPSAIQKAYGPDEIMYTQSFEESARFTGFDLTVHTYAQSNDTQELYNAANSGTGTVPVTFSEPMWGLTITNGTILESGANYARITANAGCVLTGKKYGHTKRIISVDNPLKNVGDLENRESVTSCMLSWQPDTIAQRAYNYYLRKYQLAATAKIVVDGSKPGDKVELDTLYMGKVIGTIESMRYNPKATKNIVAEVTIC